MARKLFSYLSLSLMTGIVYSFCLTLNGARLTHFLFFPKLFLIAATSGLFLLIFLFLDWLLADFHIRFRIYGFSIFVSGHYIAWTYYFSPWYRVAPGIHFIFTPFVILFLSFFVAFAAKSILNVELRKCVYLVLIVLFFLSLNLATSIAPLGWVHQWMYQGKANYILRSSLQKTLFPHSLPLEHAVEEFPWVFQKIPEGKKIMVMVLDAFREDYFGKNFYGIDLTPNMKSIANKNFYSSRYRVQGPQSKASVASLFTGKYVREHGTYHFGLVDNLKGKVDYRPKKTRPEDFFGHALPDKFYTLAERLSDQNYSNIGLHSIGHISSRYNYDQGFDHYRVTKGGVTRKELTMIRYYLYWLLRRRPNNLFVYFHFSGAHFPYLEGKKNTRFWRQTPYFKNGKIRFKDWGLKSLSDMIQSDEDIENLKKHREEIRFIRYLYASGINYYDLFVLPRFVEPLRALGLYEPSMIVITSDHGENLFDYQGFYGHGATLREPTINVPLMMKLPDKFESNPPFSRLKKENLESIDLTATLLDYANASLKGISGNSFLSGLKGEDYPEKKFQYAFSERPTKGAIHKAALAFDETKYIHDYFTQKGLLLSLDSQGREHPIEEKKSKRYREILFENLGSDGVIQDTSAKLIGIPEEGVKNLKGLGYLQ